MKQLLQRSLILWVFIFIIMLAIKLITGQDQWTIPALFFGTLIGAMIATAIWASLVKSEPTKDKNEG